MKSFLAVGLPLPLGEVDANAVSRRRGRRTRETPPVCCADRFPFLSPAVTSSPGAGEVFPQRESQGLRLVAKALGEMRKFPAVLLALPLGELSPKVTERAHGVSRDGEGTGASSLRNLFPRFPRALYLSAPGNVLYYKNKKSVRFLRPAQKALRTTR